MFLCCGSRYCVVSVNRLLLVELQTTGWLECYINKSVIKTKVFSCWFASPLQFGARDSGFSFLGSGGEPVKVVIGDRS